MTVKNTIYLNTGDSLVLTGANINGETYAAGLNKRDMTFMALGNKIITKNSLVAVTEELEPEFREGMTEYVVVLQGYEPIKFHAPEEDMIEVAARMNVASHVFIYVGNNIFNKQFIQSIDKVVAEVKAAKVK